MLSKIQGYLIAFSVAVLGVIGIYLTGRKAGKNAVNIDNALYQKESIEKAYKALRESNKKGQEVKDEAIKKADNDDYSGFNDRM